MCGTSTGGQVSSAYGRHVTSSRLETPVHATGAHRAHRRAPHPSAQRAPARYEPYLDGLFTYCLSVLCDHEAATDALGSVLAIAERQDGRCPGGEEERKSWLYALARWVCLRRLTERKSEQAQGRQAHRRRRMPQRELPVTADTSAATGIAKSTANGSTASGGANGVGESTANGPVREADPGAAGPSPAESPAAEARRRELAQLAWPEAAGTDPEQREALELAVRHGLTPRAVAAVLGLEAATARELLAAAACEVERTRAALAVVETGNCATVTRMTGDHRILLSAALRRELVQHVDDCPRCRRAAERAGAAGPWPGATVTPAAALPVVEAPRPSVYVAMVHARRARSSAPRFDRAGFPLDPKDHAARRDRLRARVVTTTVVATVVAAPVIALWAAYRGAPLTGEGHDGSSVTATEVEGPSGLVGDPYDRYENAGNARPDGDGRLPDGGRRPDVSAEVISVGGGTQGPGTLAVAARASGDRTTITLTAAGGGPVSWSARTAAPWLSLSRSSGTLAPGRSVTIHVFVNHAAEPDGPWSARVILAPSGAVVGISGYGTTSPSHGYPGPPPSSQDPTRSPTHEPTQGPTQQPTNEPTHEPTDQPTDPTPGPTDSNTSPAPEPTDETRPPEPSPTDHTADPSSPDPTGG